MKKVVFSGLVAGALMLGVSIVLSVIISAIFPDAMAEYSNSEIFRQWDDPLMYYFFFHPFVMGTILSFVWLKVKGLIDQEGLMKGAVYGFYVWLFFGVPGMLMSISTFQVSAFLVGTWTVSVLAQDLAAGVLFARLVR
jgi:hypothetical protein